MRSPTSPTAVIAMRVHLTLVTVAILSVAVLVSMPIKTFFEASLTHLSMSCGWL